MIPMEPRRPGCSVVEGKDITEPKVKALAQAADDCWQAIMHKDLDGFAKAYKASFNAQIAMFPAMVRPTYLIAGEDPQSHPSIENFIERYSAIPEVLAWKMPGAGGGGYLACVVKDASSCCQTHLEAIPLTIRRP